MHAGQAVVQIAEEKASREQFAIKLFLSRSAFQQEKGLYEDSSAPLGRFLPKLRCVSVSPPFIEHKNPLHSRDPRDKALHSSSMV